MCLWVYLYAHITRLHLFVDAEQRQRIIHIPAVAKRFDMVLLLIHHHMSVVQWFTGLNHNALVRTLETTLMQPGIKQSNVVVRVPSLCSVWSISHFLSWEITVKSEAESSISDLSDWKRHPLFDCWSPLCKKYHETMTHDGIHNYWVYIVDWRNHCGICTKLTCFGPKRAHAHQQMYWIQEQHDSMSTTVPVCACR